MYFRKSFALFFAIFSLIIFANFGEFKPTNVQAQTSSFSFVAWGDTKTGTSTLASLSNQAKKLNPNFTLYTGDVEDSGFTTSSIAGWKNAINGDTSGKTTNNIFNITFPVRGNHDNTVSGSANTWQNYFNFQNTVSSVGAKNYSYLSNNLTYSFDYGNSHFVGIDVPGDITLMTSAQINWLDSDLTTAETRGLTHAFLFWHGPIYTVDGHCCPTPPSSLITVLNKHPIISATIHGHEHVYAYVHMTSSRISSISHPFEELVCGGAGADLYSCTSGRSDWCQSFEGYSLVTVSGSTFTINYYNNGNPTPVKSYAFNKTSSTPTPTPSSSPVSTPTHTPVPTPTPTHTPNPTPTSTPISTSSPLSGDINSDGKIDIGDLHMLFSDIFSNFLRSDLNKDNKVNIFDINDFIKNFGKTTSLKITNCGTASDFEPCAPFYGTFYYMWFHNPDTTNPTPPTNQSVWDVWGQNSHTPPNNWFSNFIPDFDPATFTPQVELYSSNNDSVIYWQLKNLLYAKQNFAAASWWGQNDRTDTTFRKIITDIMNRQDNPYPNFRWSIYYENESASNPTVSQIVSDLSYIRQNYVNQNSYFKIKDSNNNLRPVIFVYADGADSSDMALRWKQAKDQEAISSNKPAFFTVLKIYSGFASDPNQPDEWHQYAPAKRVDNQGSHSFVVSPGFWKGGEAERLCRNLDGNPNTNCDSTSPTTSVPSFKDSIISMVNSSAKFKLVTTWNEWGEGTSVEPGDQVNQVTSGNATLTSNGYKFKMNYLDLLNQLLPPVSPK